MSIESLRGLAIVLMVAGHVIGASAIHGMQVADDSFWRYGYRSLEGLRRPLFTVLSGFVSAFRPLGSSGGVLRFLYGKSRRLLVPFVTVGTLSFFTQLIVPGTNNKPELGELWRIYVFGFQHFWFLQSIFLIFIVVGLLDAFGLLRTPRRWSIAFAVALAIFLAGRVPGEVNVFSLNGAIRLLPFFLLGYGLHRYGRNLERRSALSMCLAVFAVVFALRLWTILGEPGFGAFTIRALALAVGVLGVTALMLGRRYLMNRRLIWLGQYAFGIYLLHVFGSAGTRIVLDAVGISSDIAVFVVGMIGALGLPVVFEILFGRIGWVSWAVLGQKPREGVREPGPELGRARVS